MKKTLLIVLLLNILACSSDSTDDSLIIEIPQENETPVLPQNSVTDIDGNVYNTFLPPNSQKRWMKENLKVSRLNDGEPLQTSVSNQDWFLNYHQPNYSVYMNSEENNAIYGKLYNLAAVKTGKLCPQGWHISTFEDWNSSFYLSVIVLGSSNHGLNDASSFKDVVNWPDLQNSNSYGFSALPSGYRDNNGNYIAKGEETYFWTSNVFDSLEGQSFETAWVFHLQNSYSFLKSYRKEPFLGLSCRCVEN